MRICLEGDRLRFLGRLRTLKKRKSHLKNLGALLASAVELRNRASFIKQKTHTESILG